MQETVIHPRIEHAVAEVNGGQTEAFTGRVSKNARRIWIDLDNSPHVPFFAPIIEALERRGYSVTLTARDAYQVCELADLFHLRYRCVGHHWGKRTSLKVLGTCVRALKLIPIIGLKRPALAVSHGSRSQVIAAALLRVPSLSILDYEFTSSLKPFRPSWLMRPEIISSSGSHLGAKGILQYPGIKEDVYVPQFKADPSIRPRLGLDEQNVVALVRPPASEAHYHNPKSDEFFAATIEFLGDAPNVQVIVLPRNHKQAASIENSWPALFATGKLSIPKHAEDGLNLIWHSDLVISGGGTMNREAAALGIPVYSIFRGKTGAVDRYLSDSGRLVLIDSVEEIPTKIVLARRSRAAGPQNEPRAALGKIVDDIVRLAESGR
jgi:uncharacterized protein